MTTADAPGARAAAFERRDGHVLALSGHLTFATVAQAWHEGEALVRRDRPATLDLAAVRHADSAGLACVLALLAFGRALNPALHIAHAPASLRALARVSDTEAWIAPRD